MTRYARDMARRIAGSLLDLLYPPTCRICGGDPGHLVDFCLPCRSTLPGAGAPACPRCARRRGPNLPKGSTCSDCRGEGVGVDRLIAAAVYRTPMRELVHRFKFRGERSLGPPLGRCLAEAVRHQGVEADLVAPVPLHWRRALWRGYNQSEILAETISRCLGLPISRHLLRRVRATAPQSRIGGVRNRASNVLGAFKLGRGSCRGRTVLLVDDVLSTGATMAQCRRTLRRAGAAGVIGAVVAR